MTFIIRSSTLHGAGVYTTAPISRGTHVLEYTGPRLTTEQTDGLYAGCEVTYLYGMNDGKTVIDGFGMAAFVNHSCQPNCETEQIDNRVWIIAVRDIAAGEELTYDYNFYDGEPGEVAPCHCGANSCRGTMFGEEAIELSARLLRQKNKRRLAATRRRNRERRKAA
jgi:SET domain-containing protein